MKQKLIKRQNEALEDSTVVNTAQAYYEPGLVLISITKCLQSISQVDSNYCPTFPKHHKVWPYGIHSACGPGNPGHCRHQATAHLEPLHRTTYQELDCWVTAMLGLQSSSSTFWEAFSISRLNPAEKAEILDMQNLNLT